MSESTVAMHVAWPQLQVHGLAQTLEYYRDKFGFETKWSYGEPPQYACVARGEVTIHMAEGDSTGKPNTDCTDIYIAVSPVDALYAELKGRGAEITEEVGTREYGMRDFGVTDCNGYRIAFGEEMES